MHFWWYEKLFNIWEPETVESHQVRTFPNKFNYLVIWSAQLANCFSRSVERLLSKIGCINNWGGVEDTWAAPVFGVARQQWSSCDEERMCAATCLKACVRSHGCLPEVFMRGNHSKSTLTRNLASFWSSQKILGIVSCLCVAAFASTVISVSGDPWKWQGFPFSAVRWLLSTLLLGLIGICQIGMIVFHQFYEIFWLIRLIWISATDTGVHFYLQDYYS